MYLIVFVQDIQADEAKNDWKGRKSEHIQRLDDAVATNRQDLERVKAKLADYAVCDDLSDDEKDDERELGRRERKIK
jgi:hypothetical protein